MLVTAVSLLFVSEFIKQNYIVSVEICISIYMRVLESKWYTVTKGFLDEYINVQPVKI